MEVRLHMKGDDLWYGIDGRFVAKLLCKAHGKLGLEPWLDFSRIKVLRVLGTADNAELICKIYEMGKQPGEGPNVLIGSPAMVPPGGCPLQAMLQPQSVYGLCARWHPLAPSDHATYRLVATGRALKPVANRRALLYVHPDIYKAHPAYLACSFVGTPHQESMIESLARIVDPRWYVNPLRPHRINKLCRYMGLTLENCRPEGGNGRRRHVCQRLFAAWSSRVHANVAPQDSVLCDYPCNFLHRVARSFGGDMARGIFAATRRFLRFLVEVWLGEVAGVGRHKESGFAPGLFFKKADEIKAYKDHQAGFLKRDTGI